MKIFDKKTILITGGTGSFGNACVRYLLDFTSVRKIIVFSRDEAKQFLMSEKFKHNKRLRFFIGDIRDESRLTIAFKKVDFIIHAAALKHVPIAEYNPFECIKTNVNGSQNIISAAINEGIKKVIMLSTDKACNPINLYGATKLCAEKLFVNANQIRFDKPLFSVVRYGNVLSSRGSVIPFFKSLLDQNNKVLPLTHEQMTRFFISLNEATKFVLNCLKDMQGGEVFIPKMKSIYIKDLIKILNPKARFKIIGVRPGEKIHEQLFSENEQTDIYEQKNKFVAYPRFFVKFKKKGKKTKLNKYTSDDNRFLNKNLVKNSLLKLKLI